MSLCQSFSALIALMEVYSFKTVMKMYDSSSVSSSLEKYENLWFSFHSHIWQANNE
jgi:hypothetical protein